MNCNPCAAAPPGAHSPDELFKSAAERWAGALPRAAASAGVAAFIVPDLPFEESDDLQQALEGEGLALVQMVTPVTPPERLAMLCREAKGFVYAVTMTGTTGTGKGARRRAAGGARLHGPGQALIECSGVRRLRHSFSVTGRTFCAATSTASWWVRRWWRRWREARMSGLF